MSAFQIIDNIAVPTTAARKTGGKSSPFQDALEKLEVGQGFIYESPGKLNAQYGKVAPKKHGLKKFKVWAVPEVDADGNVVVDADGNIVVVPNKFGVKRLEDATPAEAAAAETQAAATGEAEPTEAAESGTFSE